MAASTLGFTAKLDISLVSGPGGAAIARPTLQVSGNYRARVYERYALTGSGTKTVALAPSPGVSLLLVYVEAATSPVEVDLGTDTIEVSAGGYLFLSNPSPTTGLTSIDLTHTTDATVQVLAVG